MNEMLVSNTRQSAFPQTVPTERLSSLCEMIVSQGKHSLLSPSYKPLYAFA
jgi:hypothetical protein